MNGIECIDDGKFTVTEERLRELLENEVINTESSKKKSSPKTKNPFRTSQMY